MKPKEDLFHLIKSLSKSEKRYFTLDAKKSGAKSSNYLNLFKAINAMKAYDETNLRSKFNNLSVDKAYLYEAILKSMRDYRSPKSKGAQLKQRIIDSKFLYERGLYEQCADRLRAAKNLATDLSDSLALLEINKEERRLVKERGISIFRKELDRFKKEKETHLQNVEIELDFLDIYDDLALDLKAGKRKSSNETEDDLKLNVETKLSTEPEGVQAKFRFYQANAVYHLRLDNAEKASYYFRKSSDFWDEHPSIKREEFFRYIKDLSNAIAISFRTGQMETVELLLKKLEEVKPDNFNEETIVFRSLISHRLNYLSQTNQYDKARQIELEIISGFDKFEMDNTTKIVITLQLADLLMVGDNLKASQLWLERIIHFKDENIRGDIQRAARILHFLLKAETDEYEVVDLLWRSYDRYFKKLKTKIDVAFELELLNLLKNIIPFPLEKKERNLIIEFYKSNLAVNSISRFIFESWLKYKGWIET